DAGPGIEETFPTTPTTTPTTPPATRVELPSATSVPDAQASESEARSERETVSWARPRVLRRWLLRRLDDGEGATLVEHLDELRSRLSVAIVAIVPLFILPFA